jgi:hypothetical protein
MIIVINTFDISNENNDWTAMIWESRAARRNIHVASQVNATVRYMAQGSFVGHLEC